VMVPAAGLTVCRQPSLTASRVTAMTLSTFLVRLFCGMVRSDWARVVFSGAVLRHSMYRRLANRACWLGHEPQQSGAHTCSRPRHM